MGGEEKGHVTYGCHVISDVAVTLRTVELLPGSRDCGLGWGQGCHVTWGGSKQGSCDLWMSCDLCHMGQYSGMVGGAPWVT